MKQIYILRDQKLLRKFCNLRDRDFKCRSAFKCGTQICGVDQLNQVEYLMNIKGMSLGEAYKASISSSLGEAGPEIIQELGKPKREYPEKTNEEILAGLTTSGEGEDE
jgi:hypothetical protein